MANYIKIILGGVDATDRFKALKLAHKKFAERISNLPKHRKVVVEKYFTHDNGKLIHYSVFIVERGKKKYW